MNVASYIRTSQIALDQIDAIPESWQSRVQTDPEIVKHYLAAMSAGSVFPSLKIFISGRRYVLVDGFHRHAAAKQLGLAKFRCDVYKGDDAAMRFECVNSNLKMGVRQTIEDKKKALGILLQNEEIQNWTGARLSEACGLSIATALRTIHERGLPRPKSNRPRVERTKLKQNPPGSIVRVHFYGRGCGEVKAWMQQLAEHAGISVSDVAEESLKALARKLRFSRPFPARRDQN